MDELDCKIVSCLMVDASLSLTKVALQIGVPAPTVYFRVNRMKRAGKIKYAFLVDGGQKEKLQIAILTPKCVAVSDMANRILERIGDALSADSDVVLAGRTGENQFVVAWRGLNFDPSRIDGVARVEGLPLDVCKE